MLSGNYSEGTSRRSFLQTVGVLSSLASLGVTSAETVRDSSSSPSDENLIVGTAHGISVADAESGIQADLPTGAQVIRRNDAIGFLEIHLPDGVSTQAKSSVVSTLERRSDVAYVEENKTYYPLQVQPSDPRFGQQYAPQLVNAPTAWESTLGSSGVTIGVVDQGVDYTHGDLQAQFGSVVGRDFVDNDSDPAPEPTPNQRQSEIHGTHVSGIASATTDNGTGVAGMSNSTILSARCLSVGGGSLGAIADGITWCADQGADLINMSIGGGGASPTLRNACNYALNNGALPIAAAGNNGTRGVTYPAGFDSVVAVSAVNSNEQLANFSQYGPAIEVTAPGVNVLSTVPDDIGQPVQYQQLSGTSMACPSAVGVAALGLAADPSMSPEELRQLLKETARDIGLPQEQQGDGLVDAAALVEAAGGGGGGNTAPSASASASSTNVDVGQSVTFDASGSSDPDGSIASYSWMFGDGASASGQTASHSYSSAGDYTATVTVTDDDGATDSDSVTITVDDGGGGGCDAPAYSNTTIYWPGDRVTYQGALWEATLLTMANPPSEGNNYWTKIHDC